MTSTPASASEPPRPPTGGAISRWALAGWAAAVALAGGLLAGSGLIGWDVTAGALALGAAPALLGMTVRDEARRATQMLSLAVWAAGGAAACLLTGGVAGPLAVWCLAPIAAAAIRRRDDLAAPAAALSVAAAAVAALSAFLLDLRPPAGPLAAWLSLLGLLTTGVALSAGVAASLGAGRRERLAHHRLQELALGQRQLFVALDGAGQVSASFGSGPEGLPRPLAGRTLAEAAVPAHREALQAAVRQARDTGLAEAGFAPAHDAEGWAVAAVRRTGPDRLVAAIRDGRSQRARELDLLREREHAEAQNAGKSRFLANMSHELRTPLNAIMGFSDIMRQSLFGPMPPRYAEYAELIHESGDHLLELINDVLDMSKIEAERFELVREAFDAREPVSGVLRLMRGQADRAGVQLRGVLPREPLEVCADRRAIKQIMLNLVSNALKFTPRGGAITVTVQGVGGLLELIVADTGVGIAPEDVERLGRPYEQAGGMDQRAHGTGLGLSLVRAFAQLHGGEMTIESELGEGTSVAVRLPVLGAEAPQPDAQREPA